MPEEQNRVNNLQDLHSKYDLHIDTPSTEQNIESKYESTTPKPSLELKDVGYGTDTMSKGSIEHIKYKDGDTPM